MSGRTPSPLQGAKPFREVGADEAGPAGRLGGEAVEALLRRRGRGRSRSASPPARAARRRGARGRRRRRCSRPRSAPARAPAARPARGRGRARARSCAPRSMPATPTGRFAPVGFGPIGGVGVRRHCSLMITRSRRRRGPRRSRGRRRRALPPAWPRPRRSRSPGTRRRRSRRSCRRGRRARSAAWGRGCGRRSRASRRRSRRGSGGAGCGRRVPKGLCGERKRSESCSNSSVVCTQTQGSKPLERTTAVGEGRAEARRNREAILGIEAVLVETPKSHLGESFLSGRAGKSWTGVMRWEEPHHPGPGLQLERHSNPLSPTLQHDLPLQPHLHPLASRDRLRPMSSPSRPSRRSRRPTKPSPPACPTTPTTCAATTSAA